MTEVALPAPRTIALVAVVVLALGTGRVVAGPGSGEPGPGMGSGDPGLGAASGDPGRGAASDDPAPRAPSPEAASRPPPVAEARSFLDGHVEDGRVVRHDQGGDTVSEGQAWALLVAVVTGDADTADAVVTWTEEHLAREDGLLAWRWADGAVVDREPASDADLVYAWALARGARAFDRPDWLDRADRVVDALADTSVVRTPEGPVLAAGPWAAARTPAVINPSYLWLAPLRWAEQRTGRLDGTVAATTALLDRLVHDDTPLVPDWVAVGPGGEVEAVGHPAGEDPPRHGLDAVRTWVWLAGDCDPEVRALAAAAAGRFTPDPSRLAALHDLDGTAIVPWRHPATLVGAAAVADAAGDRALRDARFEAAARLQAEQPTYYGAAMLALARLALDTDRLAGCDVTA